MLSKPILQRSKVMGKCLSHKNDTGWVHMQSRDVLVVMFGIARGKSRVEFGDELQHHT